MAELRIIEHGLMPQTTGNFCSSCLPGEQMFKLIEYGIVITSHKYLEIANERLVHCVAGTGECPMQ
jgi:hypothetical protein